MLPPLAEAVPVYADDRGINLEWPGGLEWRWEPAGGVRPEHYVALGLEWPPEDEASCSLPVSEVDTRSGFITDFS